MNENIPEEMKHTRTDAYIKSNVLYVNKLPQKKHVTPPSVQTIFNCDRETQARMDKIDFVHTEYVNDKGNIFTGHAAHIRSVKDVHAAYTKIHLLYPECDHHILAYAVKQYTGHHDNGQHTAGAKIQKILQQKNMNDTVLFVTREFSGIHIGQRRFIHIEKSARMALDALIAKC